jgi:predicted AAA+ superfamily ATPase
LQPQGKIYLFIDEIQNIAEWERFVNAYAQDFSENYELFITGSNSKMLSGELATLLSVRYVCFEIFVFLFQS